MKIVQAVHKARQTPKKGHSKRFPQKKIIFGLLLMAQSDVKTISQEGVAEWVWEFISRRASAITAHLPFLYNQETPQHTRFHLLCM